MLLFLAQWDFRAGVIKGIIVDSNNGNPLIGAAVVVEGTTIGTSTSVDGSFNFKVPIGKHVIKFSYVGYLDFEKNVEVTGDVDFGTIKLSPSLVDIEEVLVTASFVRDRTTPVAVSTIEPKVIVEKLGNKEFPEILKITPSVYATRTEVVLEIQEFTFVDLIQITSGF